MSVWGSPLVALLWLAAQSEPAAAPPSAESDERRAKARAAAIAGLDDVAKALEEIQLAESASQEALAAQERLQVLLQEELVELRARLQALEQQLARSRAQPSIAEGDRSIDELEVDRKDVLTAIEGTEGDLRAGDARIVELRKQLDDTRAKRRDLKELAEELRAVQAEAESPAATTPPAVGGAAKGARLDEERQRFPPYGELGFTGFFYPAVDANGLPAAWVYPELTVTNDLEWAGWCLPGHYFSVARVGSIFLILDIIAWLVLGLEHDGPPALVFLNDGRSGWLELGNGSTGLRVVHLGGHHVWIGAELQFGAGYLGVGRPIGAWGGLNPHVRYGFANDDWHITATAAAGAVALYRQPPEFFLRVDTTVRYRIVEGFGVFVRAGSAAHVGVVLEPFSASPRFPSNLTAGVAFFD